MPLAVNILFETASTDTALGGHQMTLSDSGSWGLVLPQVPTSANTVGSAMLAPWEILYIGLNVILIKYFPLFISYLSTFKFI